MTEIKDLGQFHFLNTISKVARSRNKVLTRLDFLNLLRRAALRAIEECVELCFAAGNSTGDILTAVTDAIHNEALNAEQYPSKLVHTSFARSGIQEEIADVEICLDYARYLALIDRDDLNARKEGKVQEVADRAKNGQLVWVDGNVYKKTSGRN